MGRHQRHTGCESSEANASRCAQIKGVVTPAFGLYMRHCYLAIHACALRTCASCKLGSQQKHGVCCCFAAWQDSIRAHA